MKKKNRRETIAKSYNITSAIKKKMSKEKKNDDKIDLSNLAESLFSRKEKVLSEEESEK